MSIIFNRFKKEIITLLMLIVSVVSLSSYITYTQITSSLSKSYFEKLSVVKHLLSSNIEEYFDERKKDALALGESQTTLNAFEEFERSFKLVEDEEEGQLVYKTLKEEIKNNITKINYTVPHAKPKRDPKAYLSKNYTTKTLQYLYISSNPFSTQDKKNLYASSANLSYDDTHYKYHSYFLQMLKLYDFSDIYLINMNGDVIYTVTKEHDFATNLKKGVFEDSALALVYKKALKSTHQSVDFEDFSPYEPSLNKPKAFMSTPLFKNGKMVAVVVVQLSTNRLNAIMTHTNYSTDIGLGESGEAYLVGNDSLMRSESHFKYSLNNELVKALSTTIGIISINSESAKRALNGESSHGIDKSYRGIEVYSSFAPLNILGKQYAILVEISQQELSTLINNSIITILLTSIILTFLFLLLFSYLCLHFILKPIEKEEQKFAENITLKEKELISSQNLLREYKKAVDASSIVSKTDINGIITYANDTFCEISGFTREELIGKSHNIVNHKDVPSSVFEEMWSTILQKKVWRGRITNRNKRGEKYYVSGSIIPLLGDNNEITEFISIRTDMSEVTQKEQQIQKQTTDGTTLLPNRQKLLEMLSQGNQSMMKLAIIQINRLKDVDDFYGKETREQLLINITSSLKTIIVENADSIYKINGEQFAVLDSTNMPILEFTKKMKNIIKYFDHNTVAIGEDNFNVDLTIGIATAEPSQIFFNTEMTLRKALDTSQSFLSFESADDVQKRHQENREMTVKIKNAIKSDNIIIFAQPIYSNTQGEESKYECLVRMRDGEKVISPFFFLDIAKKARLYSTITKIVIEKSFHHFKDSKSEFSINFTIDDVLNDEIVTFLKRKIKDYNIGHQVVIELVESEGIKNFEHVNKFIKEIKALGCQVAIDDFGTGYSNFEYLMKLNVDYIKIDGSLIKNIDIDESSQVVVELIVSFAKRMHIKTIAEFVHTQSVYDKVKSYDIDYSQGYHLCEPKELGES